MYMELWPSGLLTWHDKHKKVNIKDSLQPSVYVCFLSILCCLTCLLISKKIEKNQIALFPSTHNILNKANSF